MRKSNATQRSQCHAIEIEHVHGNRFVEMQENKPFSRGRGEHVTAGDDERRREESALGGGGGGSAVPARSTKAEI